MDDDSTVLAAAAALQGERPSISDAMKSFISVMAGGELAAAPCSDKSGAPRKPHEMAHLVACAKAVLRSINAHSLPAPTEWAELHPQGPDELGSERIAALTDYRACCLLAGQIAASSRAKRTQLFGRKFLQVSRCWPSVRAACEAELAAARYPPHTVEAFLGGWEAAAGDDAAESELVWAIDFRAALEARQQARSVEVAERCQRMEVNEDEAARLRHAMAAEEDTEPRLVEM